MINKKILKIIFLTFIFFPFLVSAESIPDFPMSFWGIASINGIAAPAGSIIRAYYGTNLTGQVILIENGIYGYTEPTRQKLVVGKGIGPINFTIQSSSVNSGNEASGTTLQSYPAFISGLTVQQNLNFIITSASVTPPVSSGGGGGGGGVITSSASTSSLSLAARTVDANKDNKIDVFDFNILMVNWGSVNSGNVADFNGDNKVDIFDFNLLMVNWIF